MTTQKTLFLEPLEPRLLLSNILESTDADGDRYEIRLVGPGAVMGIDTTSLDIAGTGNASRLTLRVIEASGNGRADLGHISTGGAPLGMLRSDGDVGGLTVGRLGQLEAASLGRGPNASGEFTLSGPVGTIRAPGGAEDVAFTIAGDLDRLDLGDRRDPASQVAGATFSVAGSIGQARFGQAFTADSALDAGGDIGRVDINDSLVDSRISAGGELGGVRVRGGVRVNATIEVGGNLGQLQVRKSATDLTMSVDGTVQRALFQTDLRDSTILAGAIDQIIVRDDLDDTRIGITNDLGRLQADDCRGLILRVSGRIGCVQLRRDLDNAVLSSLGGIGQLVVRQDVHRSLILAGIDIGGDWTMDTAPGGDDSESGEVRIEDVMIGGDFIDTSISAGVGANGAFFGDGNDAPVLDDIGTSRIERMFVRGYVASSSLPGESYAITASDGVDFLRVGGQEFTGVPGVVLQEF